MGPFKEFKIFFYPFAVQGYFSGDRTLKKLKFSSRRGQKSLFLYLI